MLLLGDSSTQLTNDDSVYTYAGLTSDNPRGDSLSLDCVRTTSRAVAQDTMMNIYLAENTYIRKVSAGSRTVSTYVGGGTETGDGYAGTSVAIRGGLPMSLAIDEMGILYYSEFLGCRIRKVLPNTREVYTVAGRLQNCTSMPNLPSDPLMASLAFPRGLLYSTTYNSLFFTEPGFGRILQLNFLTNDLIVLAGSVPGFVDGVTLNQALFRSPTSLWMDTADNMFIAESGNCVIRRISLSDDYVSTIAGVGANCTLTTTSDTNVFAPQTRIPPPTVVTGDNQGNIYFFTGYAVGGYVISDVDTSCILRRIVGGINNTELRPTLSPLSIRVGGVYACIFNSTMQTLTFVDVTHSMIWQLSNPMDINSSTLSLIGGFFYNVTCPHNSQVFAGSLSIVLDLTGTMYVADSAKYCVFKINNSGISMYAGTGTAVTLSAVPDVLRPKDEVVFTPSLIAGGLAGHLYVSDSSHHRIYRIDKVTGFVESMTKTGPYTNCASSNYIGYATASHFCSISSMAVYEDMGVLFFADASYTVRMMDLTSKWTQPFAGNGYPTGTYDQNADRTVATIGTITAIILNYGLDTLLMYSNVAKSIITGSLGTTATNALVGNSTDGNALDGAHRLSTSITPVSGFCSPIMFNLEFYFTQQNCKIMRFDPNDDTIQRVVGTSCTGSPSGEYVSHTSTTIGQPTSCAFYDNYLYFSEFVASPNLPRIRRVVTLTPTSTPTSPPSQPISQPSSQPTSYPSIQPSVQPSSKPSCQPSVNPTCQPSSRPSLQPTTRPTSQPTSPLPSSQPTSYPSSPPSAQPTSRPSSLPPQQPSTQPSIQPTCRPSSRPSSRPSFQPSEQPSGQPSCQPSWQPSSQPSRQPCSQPSSQPTGQPTGKPSSLPTLQLTCRPTSQPTVYPSTLPSTQPSSCPSVYPSVQPSSQPSCQPS
ncbi:hypothetical protein EON65_33140, partial [archaeon]